MPVVFVAAAGNAITDSPNRCVQKSYIVTSVVLSLFSFSIIVTSTHLLLLAYLENYFTISVGHFEL